MTPVEKTQCLLAEAVELIALAFLALEEAEEAESEMDGADEVAA